MAIGLGKFACSGDSTTQSERVNAVVGGRLDVMPNLKDCAGISKNGGLVGKAVVEAPLARVKLGRRAAGLLRLNNS